MDRDGRAGDGAGECATGMWNSLVSIACRYPHFETRYPQDARILWVLRWISLDTSEQPELQNPCKFRCLKSRVDAHG